MQEYRDKNIDSQAGDFLEDDDQENETGSTLNRHSILRKYPSRKKFSFFVLLASGIVMLAIVFLVSGKKERPTIQQEEEFQLPGRRVIELPKTASPIMRPGPVEEKIDKEALALKDARLKSAIIIYQNNSKTDAPSAEQGNKAGLSDPNQQFIDKSQSISVQTSQSNRIENLETKILQGKLIDAVMETAINSDLPGLVRAIVSYDVYGETGRMVLLPRGTRLVGQYNSAIRKGQARVFVIWNRAIRPDGIEITLNSGGVDPLGRAGIGGKVNNHFWQIFGTSTLLSLIGAGAANLGVDTADQNNSMSAYRGEIANSFQESASQVLDSYIDIPPTITVRQGTRMKVLVARDLDFFQVLGQTVESPQVHWVFHL